MNKIDTKNINNYWCKKRQDEALSDIKVINTDFYKNLPQTVCETLDKIRWRWLSYDWFEEAWNKYRDHVLKIALTKKYDDLKMPGFVFNSYVSNQVREDFLKEEERGLIHSDLNIFELYHYGIKDQKWGIRRYQNEDGSLTVLGKQRYYGDSQRDKVVEIIDVDSKPKSEFKSEPKSEFKSEPKSEPKKDSTLNELKITQKSLETTKNITDNLQKMIPSDGTKAIRKTYPDISSEELQKRLNRINLEKQYSDAVGDTKYIKTGKEKSREIFQTIGAALSIAGSIASLIIAIKTISGGSSK